MTKYKPLNELLNIQKNAFEEISALFINCHLVKYFRGATNKINPIISLLIFYVGNNEQGHR